MRYSVQTLGAAMAINLIQSRKNMLRAFIAIGMLGGVAGCALSISEMMPGFQTKPLSYLAGTWADKPVCSEGHTVVRFTPPTTQSFSISIYENKQLIDRLDCRNEYRRVPGSRVTSVECGLSAQVYIEQIAYNQIELQYVNLAQASQTLKEAMESDVKQVGVKRLFRCIQQPSAS